MYSIQRFQLLFSRLANNEKQGVRSHTVSVSGKAHPNQELSLFLELADVQAAFPLTAAAELLPAPDWSCAAFV